MRVININPEVYELDLPLTEVCTGDFVKVFYEGDLLSSGIVFSALDESDLFSGNIGILITDDKFNILGDPIAIPAEAASRFTCDVYKVQSLKTVGDWITDTSTDFVNQIETLIKFAVHSGRNMELFENVVRCIRMNSYLDTFSHKVLEQFQVYSNLAKYEDVTKIAKKGAKISFTSAENPEYDGVLTVLEAPRENRRHVSSPWILAPIVDGSIVYPCSFEYYFRQDDSIVDLNNQ